jgi:hypothetical protein
VTATGWLEQESELWLTKCRDGAVAWARQLGSSASEFALETTIVTESARQLQRALASRLADKPHGNDGDMGSVRSSSLILATVAVAGFVAAVDGNDGVSVHRPGD